MKITIHQPEHMPWLGFFHKINMADVYVVLDNVQYRRRYFQNRNKIRTKEGWRWVIVPLVKEKRDELLIKDTRIFTDDFAWNEDNLKTIYQNYCTAKYFKHHWSDFKEIYSKINTHLLDLNLGLIRFFLKKLGVMKEIVFASSLGVSGEKGELIFNICKAIGAKAYISGISGKDYLDFKKFEMNGIEVIIQEFHHPVYQQLHKPFIPCLSIIDLLFNHGEKSLDLINGIDTPVIEKIFL